MEEIFPLLVVVGDESEAFVAHYTFNCSGRHRSSSPFVRLACLGRYPLPLSFANTPALGFIFRAGKPWNRLDRITSRWLRQLAGRATFRAPWELRRFQRGGCRGRHEHDAGRRKRTHTVRIEVDDGVVFVHAMESALSVLGVRDAISGGILEHVHLPFKNRRMRLRRPVPPRPERHNTDKRSSFGRGLTAK